MKVLTILAATAAAALESASLYTQVRKAEENYRSIFENAVEGIFRSTPEGRFITVNPAMARILGYDSPEELIAEVTDVARQLYVDSTDRETAAQLEEERGVLHAFQFEAYRKDGEKIWLSLNRRSIRDQNGIELYREGSIEDITERKRAEYERERLVAEIEKQRERLNNIVATVPGVVWEAWGQPDAGTQQMNFVSDYVETMLGYSVEEWLSTPNFWLQIVHPHDREEAGREAAANFVSGKSSTVEFRWVAKDGHEIWVESNYVVIPDAQGQPGGVRGVTIDITERKRVEEALRETARSKAESLALLDTTVSSAPVGFAFHNCELVFERINETLAAINGLSVEEHLGRTLHEVLPEMAPIIEPLLQRVLDTAEPVIDFELNGETRADPGHKHHWVASFYPVRMQGGEILGVGVLVADVTARKQAEEALRESEERYRDLVENAHDIIYSHDLEGNYLSVNRAGEQATGYTHDECLQLNIRDTVAPEHAGRIREMIARKLAGETGTAYEIEIMAKDGRRIDVEVNTKLMFEDGVPVGVQGIARDITERKLAQAELTRLATAVEQTADSIVITDTDGNIQYVNPAFERITGYSKEEVLGQNPRILKSARTDPAVYRDLWQSITRGDVWVGQLVNKKKDGSLFNERATISAVRDHSGKIAHYIAVKQDTTRQILLEEQLRQSQKMEAIGQLAGGVAHDFNNLLTAINGYSSLALQRVEEHNSIRPFLEEVKKAGERAANLTRQLLAFGRKQILQPVSLNLNDVVTDLNKMLRRLIGEDIEFISKLDPKLEKIKADPGQIEQVLMNLVVNARDAMPQGGTLTIETSCVELDERYAARRIGARPGRYIMLAVSDTGIGMDEQTKARIFDPFFTTKEKGKGTGLGLSTVYGIVKQSGGNIWVYSELNRGTTFKVYLPQIETTAPEASRAEMEIAIPSGSETILLVEDEDVVRGLATQILEQAGYKVIAAARGDEAVRICRDSDEQIDLLLTDVVMPQTSGKEVADQLSQLMPGLKVLFMSGYTDEAIVHHGVLDSNIEFIQKPFTPAALATKIREVLDTSGNGHPRGTK
jgi:PAS domain S-box-containing protein